MQISKSGGKLLADINFATSLFLLCQIAAQSYCDTNYDLLFIYFMLIHSDYRNAIYITKAISNVLFYQNRFEKGFLSLLAS